MYTLVIGDKKFSSWSMRPWLVLKKLGIEFNEIAIKLDQPDTTKKILQHAPSKRVPILVTEFGPIWDSLAICYHLAESNPQLWPLEQTHKYYAQSICCEMHSGFMSLRQNLSSDFFNLNKKFTNSVETQMDIDRILQIWQDAFKLSNSQEYLFGNFSIADAYYAPVAIGRFHAYNVEVPDFAKKYINFMLNDMHVKQWLIEGLAE